MLRKSLLALALCCSAARSVEADVPARGRYLRVALGPSFPEADVGGREIRSRGSHLALGIDQPLGDDRFAVSLGLAHETFRLDRNRAASALELGGDLDGPVLSSFGLGPTLRDEGIHLLPGSGSLSLTGVNVELRVSPVRRRARLVPFLSAGLGALHASAAPYRLLRPDRSMQLVPGAADLTWSIVNRVGVDVSVSRGLALSAELASTVAVSRLALGGHQQWAGRVGLQWRVP